MPSPTRDTAETPIGFRFATVAALIRQEGYSHARAEKVLRAWEPYARYAMMSGKTPASTAEHLARFERYQPLSTSLGRDSSHAARRGFLAADAHEEARALVDQQIAADLRRHAEAIEDDNPAHAQIIHRTADTIETTPVSDSARIAAHVLRTPPKAKVTAKRTVKTRRS